MIKNDDVIGLLVKTFEDFEIEQDYADTLFTIAEMFSLYLLEHYQKKSLDKLQRGLSFIEKLQVEGDDEIKELAIVGFLEGILTHWISSDVDPEEIFEMLGLESKNSWKELNKFWDGILTNPDGSKNTFEFCSPTYKFFGCRICPPKHAK